MYGFEPINGSAPELVGANVSVVPLLSIAGGPLVWEAAQQITPWLTHTVRMFAPVAGGGAAGYAAGLPQSATFEFQSRMGPLPFVLNTGGSVVSSFAPGAGCAAAGAVSPGAALTTDTSGFQVMMGEDVVVE